MPDWRDEVRARLNPLRLSPVREREIVEELSQHLDDRWRELIAAGVPPEDARRLTLAEFADENGLARRMARLRQAHEQTPMVPGEPPRHLFVDLWRDVRYAARLAVRQPLFACLVIATLTLGLGSATTMFAVVNGVLLVPLPYDDPATLVWMYGAFRSYDSAAVSPPDFVDYRQHNRVFERLAAMAISPIGVTVAGAGAPTRMQASRVSAALVTTLGVAPALGRDFTMRDETAGSPAVIVSYRLWQDRFGGSPDVVGQSMTVDDRSCTIVGVMPAGFTLPYDSFIRLTEPVDLFLPMTLDDADAQIRRFHSLRLIGRLKPDTSLREAQTAMDVIARQLASTYPENETWHLRLVPLGERIVGAVRPILMILMAAVTLLVLVACANVASLLLARAGVRGNELAVRGALGASRGRLVRQLIVEGLALACAGAGAGLILTYWTVVWLKRLGPQQFPRLAAVELTAPVVAFALAAAAVTTLLFALAPAIHAARGDLAGGLRPGRAATTDWSRGVGQRTLVIGQLAVSVVLLASAAVLVRSFLHLASIDVGFRTDHVMVTRLPLPARFDTPAKIDGYYSALLDRLAATPTIEVAALGTAPPMSGANDTVVYRDGDAPKTAQDRRFAQIRWIQGDYFKTLSIPLMSGRRFNGNVDRAGAPAVTIVSRRTARDFFGDEDPIGRHLVIDLGELVTAEVIAVTGDVRVFGQASEAPPLVYLHARQYSSPFMQVIVRSAATTADVASAIRGHVQALDPMLAISRIDRMDTLLADSVAQPRFSMLLIGAFAGFAMILTMIGLYGTLSYLVTRREREFGIRLTVGATRRDIGQMVLRQAAGLIAAGISLGLVAALFTSRLATSLLVDVHAADPLVFAAVAALLALVSFAAVLVPTSRATRVEPLVTLRGE
jgi:putative ABC transport system permease protein